MSSWLAAGILATAGDARAEPRLLQAIVSREDGFESLPESQRPGKDRYMAPHWLAAVTLLRGCGTSRCLPVLRELAVQDRLPLNVRTAIGLTVGRLAGRSVDIDRREAESLLDALLAEPILATFVHPQRDIAKTLGGDDDFGIQPTAEDHRWQIELVVAKARLALGLEPQASVGKFLQDERIFVRRAFARLESSAVAATIIAG